MPTPPDVCADATRDSKSPKAYECCQIFGLKGALTDLCSADVVATSKEDPRNVCLTSDVIEVLKNKGFKADLTGQEYSITTDTLTPEDCRGFEGQVSSNEAGKVICTFVRPVCSNDTAKENSIPTAAPTNVAKDAPPATAGTTEAVAQNNTPQTPPSSTNESAQTTPLNVCVCINGDAAVFCLNNNQATEIKVACEVSLPRKTILSEASYDISNKAEQYISNPTSVELRMKLLEALSQSIHSDQEVLGVSLLTGTTTEEAGLTTSTKSGNITLASLKNSQILADGTIVGINFQSDSTQSSLSTLTTVDTKSISSAVFTVAGTPSAVGSGGCSLVKDGKF